MKIETRVWNGEQMVSPDYINRNGIAWWTENSIPTCATPDKVMLSTGYTDKNNQVIFEGDIVKRDIFIGVVEFKYASWHIFPKPDKMVISFPHFHSQAHEFEIIGNTFANPSLLKTE